MIDYTPLDLRRAEQMRRRRQVDTLMRHKTRDASIARWTWLLYIAVALLAAWAVVLVVTSAGNGCGDVAVVEASP